MIVSLILCPSTFSRTDVLFRPLQEGILSEAWETEDLQVTPWGLPFWDSP